MPQFQHGVPAINLEEFTVQDADLICEGAPISWKDTLLIRQLTEGNQIYTLVIYRDGKKLVAPKPLTKVMDEFTAAMHLLDIETRCQMDYLELKGSIPCVAGVYQLFSSMGASNKQSTWIMNHHIFDIHKCDTDKMIYITFDNQLTVKIDVAWGTLSRNRMAAEKMSKFQVNLDRQFNILHGSLRGVEDQWGEFAADEGAYYGSIYNINRYIRFRFKFYFNKAYRDFYGKPATDELCESTFSEIYRTPNFWG